MGMRPIRCRSFGSKNCDVKYGETVRRGNSRPRIGKMEANSRSTSTSNASSLRWKILKRAILGGPSSNSGLSKHICVEPIFVKVLIFYHLNWNWVYFR